MIPATHETSRTVADVMIRQPLTVAHDTRLSAVRAMMAACRLRHLPVTQAGRVCGIVSIRDLADRGGEPAAGAAMHAPVVSIESDAPLLTAVEILMIHHFSSLPVINDGALVGLLTVTDLVQLSCERLGDEPVSRLMTPRPLTTIAPDQTLSAARSLMKAERVRHLPVVDGDRLVGFVSDLDVLAGESDQTIAAGLPTHFASVSPEGRAADAGRLLARKRIDAMPTVRAGRLVGVLSAFDFLSYLRS